MAATAIRQLAGQLGQHVQPSVLGLVRLELQHSHYRCGHTLRECSRTLKGSAPCTVLNLQTNQQSVQDNAPTYMQQ